MTLLGRPWLWAWVGALAVFAVTIAATAGASAAGLAQATFTFAAFTVIVGLGQMFVITLGPGNIDLSIPATMTLAGTVSLKVMDGQNDMILPGLMIALGIGAGVGVLNYALIKALRIPPIIATLAMSFIVQSAAIWTNRGLRVKPPDWLAGFSTGTSCGMPNVALVAGVLTVAAWVLLNRTAYGRRINAIGQSLPAARMAGVPGRWHAAGHLHALRHAGRAVRLPARQLFRWGRAEHGGRVPAGLHRGRGDRRHVGRRGQFQRAGDLGRGAVPVPRRLDAQHLRVRRRAAADPDRLHHHCRDPGRQRAARRDTRGPSHDPAVLRPARSALSDCAVPYSPMEEIATGCRWTEGPVWFGDHGCLLFSDIPNERILRWMPGWGSVFRQPSNFANGHTRDRQGRLVSCEHGRRRVTRTEADGSLTVLADSYGGRRLNSPNDVVVRPTAAVWFTDPTYGILSDYEGYRAEPEQIRAPRLPHRPRQRALAPVVSDFVQPNGLCFSPDESLLYIAESGSSHDPAVPSVIRRFQVTGAGLSGGEVFATIDDGLPDGIRCDTMGNLWSSAEDGVHIFRPRRHAAGQDQGAAAGANLTFGGPRRNRLFITATTSVYLVYVAATGAQTP
jgi:gluconolactonase